MEQVRYPAVSGIHRSVARVVERVSLRPMRVLATGVMLTLSLFLSLGWALWHEYARQAAAIRDSRLETLSAASLHLDEVLTMTARMAAVTGDVRWEERYKRFEPELEAVIRGIIGLTTRRSEASGIVRTYGANVNLVRLEREAFALVRQGRREEAEALLFGERYDEQKRGYANGVRSTLAAVKERVGRERSLHEQHLVLVGAVAVAGLLSLLGTWLAVLGLLRFHLTGRRRAEGKLRESYEELELRVQDRTAHLAAANDELHQEVTERKRVEEELASKREQLEQFARHRMHIEEELRCRIARELHDELGQSLTVLSLDVQRHIRDEQNPESWGDVVDELQRMIKVVREISYGLRPPELESLGIVKSLESLKDPAERLNGTIIRVNASLKGRLSPVQELCLYRVAQEAVTNALRHGQAKNVEVSLQQQENWMALNISDDGEGFDNTVDWMGPSGNRKRGLGLIGMRERVGEFGGTLHVDSAPGQGTRVTARLPMFAKDARPCKDDSHAYTDFVS